MHTHVGGAAQDALDAMQRRLQESPGEATRIRPFVNLTTMLLMHHLTEPSAYAQVQRALP